MSTKLDEMIDNLINGNLTDAKRQAERLSGLKIRDALIERGFSEAKASLTAGWLKGCVKWQTACDAR